MTEDFSDNASRAMAAALLLGRSEAAPQGPVPDLSELEGWRSGLLDPARAREVLAHLCRDPGLMRQLMQLESAAAELRQGDARTEAPPVPAWLAWGQAASRRLGDWLLDLTRPAWAGGLAAVAAVVMLTLLIPALYPPDLDRQLDALYADQAAEPFPPLQWPWRAADQTKALDFWPDAGKRPPIPEKLAFQSGVRLGLERLGAGGEPWGGTLSRLPSQPPACAEQEPLCPERLQLARQTGHWAVVFHRQCMAPAGTRDEAASLGGEIRRRWSGLDDPGEMGARMEASGGDPCEEVARLLDWGLR